MHFHQPKSDWSMLIYAFPPVKMWLVNTVLCIFSLLRSMLRRTIINQTVVPCNVTTNVKTTSSRLGKSTIF